MLAKTTETETERESASGSERVAEVLARPSVNQTGPVPGPITTLFAAKWIKSTDLIYISISVSHIFFPADFAFRFL